VAAGRYDIGGAGGVVRVILAGVAMQIQDKLVRIEDLDERIERARRLERRAIVRGMVLAVATLTIMGAWSRSVDTIAFDLFRYGGAFVFVGAEYTIRRLLRQRLQDQQERLTEPY
jgi:hypothetical protein